MGNDGAGRNDKLNPSMTYQAHEHYMTRAFELALQSYSEGGCPMGGVMVDRERALDAKTKREQAAAVLRNAIEAVQEMGCQVKDLDTGLVDFPTLFRGVEVLLCWKLGEPGIEYWHGVEEGFRGRKAIDQDFLDHHEGDRSH